LSRIQKSYEHNISEAQFGFRKGRSTSDAIFIVKNVIQKFNDPLIAIFIDLTAAYDHIPRDFLFRVISFRTGSQLLTLILSKIYEHTTAYISGTKAKFDILIGCRQGGLESPTLFNYYFDFVLKVCAKTIDQEFPDGWGVPFTFRIPNECTKREQRIKGKMNGVEIMRWVLYADDMVLFSTSLNQASQILKIIDDTCRRFGLSISYKKTKTMVFNDIVLSKQDSIISINGRSLGNVSEFCYLGHTIFNTKDKSFTELRISKATQKFQDMKKVLTDGEIEINVRKKFLEACVRSRLVYATQSCFPYEAEMKKLESCWYGCLRMMVRGGYRRKPSEDGETENFAYVYSNSDLERMLKTMPVRQFITVQYLKYIAHICRSDNTNLTKISMFFTPTKKYYHDPWIIISKHLGGISITQAKRETQSRTGFIRLLCNLYPQLQKSNS
jgi:hypothetical protein